MTTQRLEQECVSVEREAYLGNVDAVRKWLHAAAGGRYNDKKQESVLYAAAEYGHTDICQLLIETGRLSSGVLAAALQIACTQGHLPVVQLLINTLGQRFDNDLFIDSLHIAVVLRNTEVVDWLLSLTHPPAAADTARWALVAASADGHLEAVTLNVNKIGPNVTDLMSHALWTACYSGEIDVVDWLMKNTSADVNQCATIYHNIGAMTSLAVACYEGHMVIASRLLMYATPACDVNMTTSKTCNTALHEAIWSAPLTPQHEACYEGDTAAVADVLRENENDVNKQNLAGSTPLHIACVCGHVSIVRMLLAVFADTDITDDFGDTPLRKAVQYVSHELVHYMENLMYATEHTDTSQ